MFKVDARWVSPVQVEDALREHPAVRECGVTWRRLESLVKPVAHVVLRPHAELSPEAIVEYAACGMAKYKRLARVIITDSIPRSPSGKILRRVLKAAQAPPASPGGAPLPSPGAG